jgi:hypothetical protein
MVIPPLRVEKALRAYDTTKFDEEKGSESRKCGARFRVGATASLSAGPTVCSTMYFTMASGV